MVRLWPGILPTSISVAPTSQTPRKGQQRSGENTGSQAVSPAPGCTRYPSGKGVSRPLLQEEIFNAVSPDSNAVPG
jgi:hypothetical protein